MTKITKKTVDALKPSSARDTFVWDGELRGFGIRLKPSGAGAYLIQYRTSQGATRRKAIGKLGTLAPDEARKLARADLARVAAGEDPSGDRKSVRSGLRVADLCAMYLEAARSGLVVTRFGRPKKPSTIEVDEGRIGRHILPLIGREPALGLGRAVVQRMFDAIAQGKTAGTFPGKLRGRAVVTGGAGTAGRVVELLGGIWTWAEKRGVVTGDNPARGVDKLRGQTKERMISAEELVQLGATLRSRESLSPLATAALRLIALSAMRRQEACRLRWAEVDVAGACVRLEETKTGKSLRALGRPAVELLAKLQQARGASEWVFPARRGDGPAMLAKELARLFDEAGLPDVRSQGLRVTYASLASDEGYSDATVGELLGHARSGVTRKHYIRRPDAALIAAADRVSARIAAALDVGEGKAQVVPIGPAAMSR